MRSPQRIRARPPAPKQAPAAPALNIRKRELWIKGVRFPLEAYAFEKQIGKGANAAVFKTGSLLLKRIEAVKIYLPKPGDKRDKLKQGAFESQKQAAAAFQNDRFHVINIFHAGILNGYFYTTMEFFDGPNLKTWVKTASLVDKWRMAHLYNDAMNFTSMPTLFHGDPHMGNILVGKDDIAICDYGTSHFTSRAYGWKRHWGIVDKVMTALLSDFESFTHYRKQWPDKTPGMIFAAYRDVLRALTTELFDKTDGTPDEVPAHMKGTWQYQL